MFDVEFRRRVDERIRSMAEKDPRATAGAVVGSLALTDGDRFSDLDLAFAVADGVALLEVLNDWTRLLDDEFGVDTLFDLPSGSSVYRVLLFPGALEVDLSVTPAADFGPRGDTFRLLFGREATSASFPARTPQDVAGHGVHHALHARTAIERERSVQAQYWIGELRNEAVTLASMARGSPSAQARGAHQLPADVVDRVERTLVRSLDRDELDRSLREAIRLLLSVCEPASALARSTRSQLGDLVTFRTAPN